MNPTRQTIEKFGQRTCEKLATDCGACDLDDDCSPEKRLMMTSMTIMETFSMEMLCDHGTGDHTKNIFHRVLKKRIQWHRNQSISQPISVSVWSSLERRGLHMTSVPKVHQLAEPAGLHLQLKMLACKKPCTTHGRHFTGLYINLRLSWSWPIASKRENKFLAAGMRRVQR